MNHLPSPPLHTSTAVDEERMPLWALLAGLLVTGVVTHAVWHFTSSRDETDARIGFEARASQIDIALRERMRDHEQALLGMSTIFAAGVPLDRTRWIAQFELLRLGENQPGFQETGYAPFVTSREKQRHEAAMRKSDYADYAIYPEGERPGYVPIAYLAPAGERQRKTIGFDMAHEPLHRAALETARDKGQPVITRKIILSPESETVKHSGVLMALPIYRRDTAIATVTQRQDAIQGYVFGALRARELIDGLAAGKQDLRVEIFDGAGQHAGDLLYDNLPPRYTSAPTTRFVALSTIALYNGTWSLRVSTLPEFDSAISYSGARVATASALLISLLALTMIWSQLTLRRRAEGMAKRITYDLAQSREQLALALEGSDLALFDWNVGSGEVQLSARWSVMRGGKAEPVRTTLKELETLVPPEDRSNISANIAALLDGRSDRYIVEHRVRRYDGTMIWIASHAKIVERDSMQRPLRLVGTNVDISQRKEMDRIKSEFISTVSHELRTPITALIGALGLLRKGVVGTLPDKATTFLDMAYQNGERLSALVNDILTLEDTSAGRMAFNITSIDLAPFLERAITMNAGLADKKHIRFALDRVTPSMSIRADNDRLMQVITNLLSNAVKFSATDATVRLATEKRGAVARVSVMDHGPGIPHEFRPRIFERFMQADGSSTRSQGGTGLGLAVCKTLIEGMGGQIGYTSEVGSGATGTTFYFDLPLAGDAVASPTI
ncbi:MAG: CHASE domain-containing protein [Burkholderiales bacterium]